MSWDAAERRIREAQARGEFDDLPLAGKPLELGDPDDPDWWIKNYLRREGVEPGDALPRPLALRRERETYPEALADLAREADVREVVEDFNRRVRTDWLTPHVPPLPHARPLDVEEMVERWRTLRRTR